MLLMTILASLAGDSCHKPQSQGSFPVQWNLIKVTRTKPLSDCRSHTKSLQSRRAPRLGMYKSTYHLMDSKTGSDIRLHELDAAYSVFSQFNQDGSRVAIVATITKKYPPHRHIDIYETKTGTKLKTIYREKKGDKDTRYTAITWTSEDSVVVSLGGNHGTSTVDYFNTTVRGGLQGPAEVETTKLLTGHWGDPKCLGRSWIHPSGEILFCNIDMNQFKAIQLRGFKTLWSHNLDYSVLRPYPFSTDGRYTFVERGGDTKVLDVYSGQEVAERIPGRHDPRWKCDLPNQFTTECGGEYGTYEIRP